MHNDLILSTIPGLVKKNKFLPVNALVGKNWSGTDTKELYEQNLKTKPADWYYRNNQVRYTFNKDGYRTDEFKKIDWANSVVVFGCSNAFGVGIDDADTTPAQLSRLINKPVINMGVGGSSMMFNFHNSSILRSNYPTPLAVVQLWPDYSRIAYYEKRNIISHGNWNQDEEDNYWHHWIKDDSHSKVHALFASKISKTLWEDTAYCEFSFFTETAKLLDCGYLENVDEARDIMHHGPKTHAITAQRIANMINL